MLYFSSLEILFVTFSIHFSHYDNIFFYHLKLLGCVYDRCFNKLCCGSVISVISLSLSLVKSFILVMGHILPLLCIPDRFFFFLFFNWMLSIVF